MEFTKEIMLPSSKIVIMRETNGDDDAILSKMAHILTGENFTNFISSIIEKDMDLGKKPMPEEILDWKLNDRYSFLLKQRIFNHGPELDVNYDCSICGSTTEHHINLEDYDTSFDDNFREIADQYYSNHPNAIRHYPNGKDNIIEFRLDEESALFKFHILTSRLEDEYNKLVKNDSKDKNSMLFARKLQMFDKDNWKDVTFFRNFSSRNMVRIRGVIKYFDGQWDPVAKLKCEKCNNIDLVSILTLPSFWFPEVKI